MVSNEEHEHEQGNKSSMELKDRRDGIKRKSILSDTAATTGVKVTKIDGMPTARPLKLLERINSGDLDLVDGIEDGDGQVRMRNRTLSEYAPVRICIETNRTAARRIRRRNFSACDAGAIGRSLLGSFTESALNGRLDPVKVLDGFTLQLVASSSTFTGPHVNLPVTVYFFDLNTTGDAYFPSTPVPYLGKCMLAKEYRIPRKGNLQVTLFNPQRTVVKMFLTKYNVEDMPANSRTFIRHIWQWHVRGAEQPPKNLQHLIHYRLASDRRNRVHLHTDVRILFAQDSARDALLLPLDNASGPAYQLVDRVETPSNPRYSHAK